MGVNKIHHKLNFMYIVKFLRVIVCSIKTNEMKTISPIVPPGYFSEQGVPNINVSQIIECTSKILFIKMNACMSRFFSVSHNVNWGIQILLPDRSTSRFLITIVVFVILIKNSSYIHAFIIVYSHFSFFLHTSANKKCNLSYHSF